MAIRRTPQKVHPDTATIARQYAREDLGVQNPKLRAPSKREVIETTTKAFFDTNQVRDSVVIMDKKSGKEFLLMVDLDPAKSRVNNIESAMLTATGIIPLVGAPVVAAFAIKDLVKGGSAMAKAKAMGEATDPADRAAFRMGIKHLGLSGLSMATTGASSAVAATVIGKDIAEAAYLGHQVVVGAEVVASGHDTVNANKHKADRNNLFKTFCAALQGLAGVHHGEARKPEDARIVLVQITQSDGSVDRKPEQPVRRRDAGEGANAATGPPAPPG